MSIRLRSAALWLGGVALVLAVSSTAEKSAGLRVASTVAAGQAQPKRSFAAEVRLAIDRGVQFLKTQQRNGSWEHMGFGIGRYQGGMSSLALLALLEAGVRPDDDVIQKGLAYLRTVPPSDTYVVGLQTMVFSKADPDKDRMLIRRNVTWLRESLRFEGNQAIGWGYQKPPGGLPGADNSNSQYAVLGLREASLVGVKVDDAFWKQVQNYYLRAQQPDGGWAYRVEARGSTITMTSAGISSLLIAGMQLYKNNEVIDKDGTIHGCGAGKPDEALERALQNLGENFTVDGRQWRYYHLYGIERAGRLSGQRFFVGRAGQAHDWYRAGAEFLLNQQNPSGGWKSEQSALDGNPIIATSFSLLFLSKGKTPVLIHKMMHGPANRRGMVGDWNNDRNDARNLTEFCSQHIFRKDGKPVPLTWQAFDASKLDPRNPESVAEMLQAPIVYFNGHQAPRFTDGEKHLLKQYVDQGGFIVAEACCGRKEFDRGFRQLVSEIWPDRGLEPLTEGHDIWQTPFKVPPGAFKLEGIDFGCKTSVVYAPEDLSCHWESNKFEGPEGRTFFAFRLGANIVAYATGLEPPEDKLENNKDVIIAKPDVIKRNFLRVAQLNFGGRDWQPAPNAMRNLMNHMRRDWNIDVILETKPITLGDPNLPNYPFLYMHGRRAFTIPPESQKTLREHLEYGGLLLADACCGHKAFDESFRKLMEETFGPERRLEPIKLDDPFFSDRIGKELKTVKCRTRGGLPYTDAAPQLEGIRLDPKNLKSPWIVIYSKYDLGCALDRHASPDCLGHDHNSALEIAAQAVLYALKE